MFNLEIMYRSVCLSYHVGWLIVTNSTVHTWLCIWNRELCTFGCGFGMIARSEDQTWMAKMMFNCFIFFVCNCRGFWYAELVTVLLCTLAKTRTERLEPHVDRAIASIHQSLSMCWMGSGQYLWPDQNTGSA